MAQQVERFTRNEQVGGSNPPTSSKRPKRDKRLGLFHFLIFRFSDISSFIPLITALLQKSVQDSV